jgi:hypothetical protein
VPVGFLTDEQRQRYGRFHGEVNSEDISRYFHMDDSDRNLIALHRGNHNRLGFAVQLCTVRYLGAFPEDLTETPATVVSILGRQLDIEDNCGPLWSKVFLQRRNRSWMRFWKFLTVVINRCLIVCGRAHSGEARPS